MWLSPIPPLLQSESANEFLQANGCHYSQFYDDLKSWITSGNKCILDTQSSNKLIYLANFIEKAWYAGQQIPIWRKHPTNRLNGYAYNIIQILMHDKISDNYPTEDYATFHYDLLSKGLKNKRLNRWICTYQKNLKDPFVVASMELTRIWNKKSTFLWQITLETVKGLYTSLAVEAIPGDSYLSYSHPVRQKRAHSFIGYI